MLQRGQCDRPASALRRPGKARVTDSTALGPSIATMIGDEAWELYNFDIDKPYTKKEHEQYVKDEVVPKLKKLIEDKGAYVLVAGEASSTASGAHNWTLSRKRAQCVLEIVKRELLAAGVTDTGRVLPPVWAGEIFSYLRRGDEVEEEEDRRVTILAVESDPNEVCPEGERTRGSHVFRAKIACDSPGSVLLNIADVSDTTAPTWRAFKWVRSPSAAADCEFRATTSGNVMPGARRDFHLALRDPDDLSAPSDLQGETLFNVGFSTLFSADKKFSVKLAGKWTPKACADRGGEIPGWLYPIGPVFCGEAPQPKRAAACDEKSKECTDAEKLAPATKFGAMMERVGIDLPLAKVIKRLPAIARHLLSAVDPELGVALVHIGTLEGPEPRRTRTFLFVGFSGDASGLDGQVGFDKDATSSEPLQLATEDPGTWDSDSDFDSDLIPSSLKLPEPAELVIRGDSNVEELHVGGMTFEFSGLKCNSGGSRTIYGWFGGVTSVACSDLGPLIQHEPKRDCEADDCSEDEQLAGHDAFTFKVGRASLASLPFAGRRLADRYGCELVAAYLNVGTEGDDPIHRKFLYIGRRKGCRYDVEKGSVSKQFLLERQLSLDDPEDPIDLSDFAGKGTLKSDGELTVIPIPNVAKRYSVKLPGKFDAACTDVKLVEEGGVVPLDDVRCGPVPEPLHDTTPDPDPHAACRAYTKMHPVVADGIERLKNGGYDDILDVIPDDLGFGVTYFEKPLNTLFWVIGPLRPAIFVGKTYRGIPVVTFVEMEVVSYNETSKGEPLVTVRFVSDACSYDKDGNPVFVQPVACKESLPYKGLMTRLRSLPAPASTPAPPPQPTVPAPPDSSSGTGSGSRTAAVPPPDEPVPV